MPSRHYDWGVEEKYPSEVADRFMVRMPDGMRDRIAREAERNGRSMNAEIVLRLQNSLDQRPNIQWAAGSAPLDMVSRNRPLVDSSQLEELAKLVVQQLRKGGA